MMNLDFSQVKRINELQKNLNKMLEEIKQVKKAIELVMKGDTEIKFGIFLLNNAILDDQVTNFESNLSGLEPEITSFFDGLKKLLSARQEVMDKASQKIISDIDETSAVNILNIILEAKRTKRNTIYNELKSIAKDSLQQILNIDENEIRDL